MLGTVLEGKDQVQNKRQNCLHGTGILAEETDTKHRNKKHVSVQLIVSYFRNETVMSQAVAGETRRTFLNHRSPLTVALGRNRR